MTQDSASSRITATASSCCRTAGSRTRRRSLLRGAARRYSRQYSRCATRAAADRRHSAAGHHGLPRPFLRGGKRVQAVATSVSVRRRDARPRRRGGSGEPRSAAASCGSRADRNDHVRRRAGDGRLARRTAGAAPQAASRVQDPFDRSTRADRGRHPGEAWRASRPWRVAEVLRLVGLGPDVTRQAARVSAGSQQRVNIARDRSRAGTDRAR